MTDEMQALCFIAGANSIFVGDKLLTAGNPGQGPRRGTVRPAGHRGAGDLGETGGSIFETHRFAMLLRRMGGA